MSDKPVLAVYGGAFDPPHLGHVLVVGSVLSLGATHQVWAVPTFRHAFGKEMQPYERRLEMVRAAFRIYGRRVRVSDIERKLAADGQENRSIRTLDAIAEAHPEAQVRLVIGADIWAERHEWFDFERIEGQYAPLIVGREGHPLEAGLERLPALPDISSRDIRAALRDGARSISGLPAEVAELIHRHDLYKARPQDNSEPNGCAG